MKPIPIRNVELLATLHDFEDEWEKADRTKFPLNHPEGKFDLDYCTSSEYLTFMQGKVVDGFPEKTFGIDMMRWSPPGMGRSLQVLDIDLLAWSGCRFNAVKMHYPVHGFMGWHHNANCPGYNVLLSYSYLGTGFFRYQDPLTKEIVTMKDSPGWSAKVGYYGSWTEPDRIYWHCAGSPLEERLTLGYVIPHEGLWLDMVEDIQRP